MKNLIELEPNYDTRKSFYHKAYWKETEHRAVLYSYGIKVMNLLHNSINLNLRLTFNKNAKLSQTTMRHIRECIYTFDMSYGAVLKKLTAKQIKKSNYKLILDCINKPYIRGIK